jgi:predicted transcriptional regulator
MDKKLLELAVEIIQSQVAMSKMSGEEIEAALIRVYNALHQMRQAEEEGRSISLNGRSVETEDIKRDTQEKVDARSSVQEDKVICLECGADFRQLTANHLKTHQLTPREYKRKWGFSLKQPLAAKLLTKLRSRSAKKRGLPKKLQQYLEDQRQKKSERGLEGTNETKKAGSSTRG